MFLDNKGILQENMLIRCMGWEAQSELTMKGASSECGFLLQQEAAGS